MSQGILESICQEGVQKRDILKQQQFSFTHVMNLAEHNTRRFEIIYSLDQINEFLWEVGTDPLHGFENAEQHDLYNLAEQLRAELYAPQSQLLVLSRPYPTIAHPLLREHYRPYALYQYEARK